MCRYVLRSHIEKLPEEKIFRDMKKEKKEAVARARELIDESAEKAVEAELLQAEQANRGEA